MFLLKIVFKRIPLYILLLVSTISFVYVSARSIPGDPVTVLYGEVAGDTEVRRVLEHQLGLDRPLYIQILIYLRNIFTGTWGRSIYTGESVTSIIFRGFTASIRLAFISSILVLAFCITILYLEFVYNIDSGVVYTIATLFGSIPTAAWSAILLLLLVRFRQPIVIGSTVPPLIVLTVAGIGIFYRLLRSAVEYSCRQPFVEMYIVMGFSKKHLFLKVLRYALPVALSATLYRIGLIIAGAVAVEIVFMYPGMGFVFYTALLSRDYPVLIGWGTTISIASICINFAIDVAHRVLDPRVSAL